MLSSVEAGYCFDCAFVLQVTVHDKKVNFKNNGTCKLIALLKVRFVR